MLRRVLCVVALSALVSGCSAPTRRVTASGPAATTTPPMPNVAVDSGGGADTGSGPAAGGTSPPRGSVPTQSTVPGPYRATAAPRRLPPAPRYTHLQVRVDTDADWMTAGLAGARLVSARVSQVSSGATASTTASGISVARRATPLARSDGKPQSATADVVYQVPDGSAPVLQVCKGSDGGSHVALQRATQAPGTVVAIDDHRTDGGTDGCPNGVAVPVAPEDLLGPVPWPPRLDPRRLALAFYYPWYSRGSFDSGQWRDSPTQPWNTDDPGEVARMVDQARASAVDGFIVSYQDDPVQVRRMDAVAQAAASRSFVVAPLFEMDRLPRGGPNAREAALLKWFSDALARASAPAYLKVGDRPVVFVYHDDDVSPDAWRSVRQQLRQQGANPFIVADKVGPDYDFDGLYAYSPNASSDGQLGDFYGAFVQGARFDPAVGNGDRQRLWAAPVSPGEDNSSDRPPSQATVVDRRGGARYDATWAAASATSPEWILVTTWNEWTENTEVAPSAVTGTRALDQTASWSAAFHGGDQ